MNKATTPCRLSLHLKTNIMKKLFVAVFVFFSCFAFCSAQDFSFDELVNLRTTGYHAFGSYVHDKGYNQADADHDQTTLVLRNGKNVISYSHRNYGDGLTYHRHPSVIYETPNKADFEILKKQIEAGLKYYSIKQHKNKRMHYTEYIYGNDTIVARLYDIKYRDDSKPYYQVVAASIYAGLEEEL